MPKRTSPKDAHRIETADDLEDVVVDKREGWRATPSKNRRRQRRYKKKLITELLRMAQDDEQGVNDKISLL